MIKIYDSVEHSLVDGRGVRTVYFMSGCIHACVGCHSPHTWSYENGRYIKTEDILESIKDNELYIDGITFSGGDPLYQLNDLIQTLKDIRADKEYGNINIWVYTGYKFEEIPFEVKKLVDVFITEKYVDDLPPGQFRGSVNQRIMVKDKYHNFTEGLGIKDYISYEMYTEKINKLRDKDEEIKKYGLQ